MEPAEVSLLLKSEGGQRALRLALGLIKVLLSKPT